MHSVIAVMPTSRRTSSGILNHIQDFLIFPILLKTHLPVCFVLESLIYQRQVVRQEMMAEELIKEVWPIDEYLHKVVVVNIVEVVTLVQPQVRRRSNRIV